MRATLRRNGKTWTWRLKLGGRLPRGTYTVQVRAVDALGNVSKSLAGGKPRVRVGR
jgi:hypothetical protein